MSCEGGTKFLEAAVSAGLPILSAINDLVATGDKVRVC
jgi:homoserine dehydrogenase